MMITITSRLRLRDFTPDDVDVLAPILADPEMMRFSLSDPETREQTAAFITWCREQYTRSGFGLWAVIHAGDRCLIGYCGLSEWEIDGAHEVEVGYRLDPHYWGQGLATEAAQEHAWTPRRLMLARQPAQTWNCPGTIAPSHESRPQGRCKRY